MIKPVFDPEVWQRVPFHFWSVVFFIFGSMVGSFLNVCIHRMPLGQSIVRPPSHCPHCKYSIPWYLNIPLITWLFLKGRCRNCGAAISIRYYLVELLTGVAFLSCWFAFGQQSAALALVYALFVSGLIAATFIDFEHFIIPDEITIGGTIVGFVCSLLVASLHPESVIPLVPVHPPILNSLCDSVLGLALGAGLIYAILRLGKLFFGRKRFSLPPETKIIFSETAVLFEGQALPYEEVFYRPSDAIMLHARTLELADRCYENVIVRLSPSRLFIGDEELDPETIPHMEAVSEEIVVPQEAMGLGDVKFMAAIGAFLGWRAVLVTLLVSSLVGSIVGLGSIVVGKRGWSSRLPYGPYIAIAAVIFVFWGQGLIHLWHWWNWWVTGRMAGAP
jgi:leader peptidase (prepilin peptidase)/N-methyltransferase